MKRKLIKQGGGGYTIYLPKKWIDKRKLKGTDSVDLEETEQRLIISTKNEFLVEKAEIDITHMAPIQFRTILALYKKGCDEITIRYEDLKTPEKLQRVLSEMIGFEMISQTRNTCIIKEISKPTEEEFQNILRRAFLLVKMMSEEILSSLKEGKSLEHIEQMDININKFCHFCIRMLNTRGHADFNKTTSVYYIVNELEKIGDLFKEFSKNADKKTSKNMIVQLETINELFEKYQNLFFDFSKEKAVIFAKEWQKIKKDLDSQKEEMNFLASIHANMIKMFEEQLTYEL